jgi:WW domain-binding protein 4
MGSDRQSILIHENGRKHRENMESNILKRREEKLREEKEAQDMQRTLKLMEDAAGKKILEDVALGSFRQGGNEKIGQGCNSSAIDQHSEVSMKLNVLGEMKSWQERKGKRRKTQGGEGNNDEDVTSNSLDANRMKIELGPNEGHYQVGNVTYLEGSVYSAIFEQEMPVQIWTGSETMTDEYRKSDEAQILWKMGIIIRVHKDSGTSSNKEGAPTLCDVSYLNNPDDDDETIEYRVEGRRLRLIVGSDELIPSTIEEARLSLIGGEEVIHVNNDQIAEIDENTGLSRWGTVSLRKVTVSQEIKEQRLRARIKRQEEAEKEKMRERDIQARLAEEARHSNFDDSALGAYRAWEISGGKGGYKGVQIDAETPVQDTGSARSVANGNIDVKFKTVSKDKMSSAKRAKLKQNKRKTFADDEEDES